MIWISMADAQQDPTHHKIVIAFPLLLGESIFMDHLLRPLATSD